MINLDEINKTILELEGHDTTYATCEKLAWLYIVRDHMSGNNVSRETISLSSNGELAKIIQGKPLDLVIPVLEEHMEVVRLLHPKEYKAVIDKLTAITS